MMKHKAVIFDLDGTLVDTLGDIAASMNRALVLHGFPALETEAYRAKVGWGLRKLASLCLPESRKNDSGAEEAAGLVADDAIKFYNETPLKYTTVYPGMGGLVSELRQRKMKTAVLTNKVDPVARVVVNGLFAEGSFDIIRGETQGRPRKPDPACVWELLVEMNLCPADVIFVGDSEIDIETAVTSGCYPLGVSWGYRSRETIINAGARRVIDRAEELLELL